MTVADALAIYGREHAPTIKDPVRIGYAIEALFSNSRQPAGGKHHG